MKSYTLIFIAKNRFGTMQILMLNLYLSLMIWNGMCHLNLYISIVNKRIFSKFLANHIVKPLDPYANFKKNL